MHELAITQSVVSAVTQRMRDAPVRRIRLEVGRLSGLVPDSVRFCFEMVAAGTTCEGAALEIDEPAGARPVPELRDRRSRPSRCCRCATAAARTSRSRAGGSCGSEVEVAAEVA